MRKFVSDIAGNGLSPLTRGTRDEGGVWIVEGRFIPADAGNTVVKNGKGEGVTVYPR